jgi:cytochrome c556
MAPRWCHGADDQGRKAYDNAAIQASFAAEEMLAPIGPSGGAPIPRRAETSDLRQAGIWTDAAGFEAAGGVWYKAYQTIKATTDEASFKAAFPALGESCKGCHEKFRRPKG